MTFGFGLIKINHLVIAERKEFVGRHVGETAPKTSEVIKQAMEGLLFIDEAYSLINNDSPRDFGIEAIDMLLTAMNDHIGHLVVIFAGYYEEMDHFLDSNPGLRSRVGYTFDFKDYNVQELTEIFV